MSKEKLSSWSDCRDVFFGSKYAAKDALVIGGLVSIGLGTILVIVGLIFLVDNREVKYTKVTVRS